MVEAITFERVVVNPDNGREAHCSVPGSVIFPETGSKITTEYCFRMGVNPPLELFDSEEERRQAQAKANGVVFIPGQNGWCTQTLESVYEEQVASQQNMSLALKAYEPAVLQPSYETRSEQGEGASSVVTAALTSTSSFSGEKILVPPERPLDAPQISNGPRFERNQMYTACESAQSASEKLEANIFRRFLDVYKFINYEGTIYVFDPTVGHYVPCSDDKLRLLINACFGEELLNKGKSSMYKHITTLLHADASICVDGNKVLGPDYWPFRNCIINIWNGKILVNDGSCFIRSCLQCDFDPAAECPEFCRFLLAAASQDPEVYELLWIVTGYILSTDNKGKCFFVFVGPKNCGKSLLANIISEIIGESSVSTLSIRDFDKDFGPADLIGKQLNTCMDLPNTPMRASEVAIIKRLTGNDLIRADIKYQPAVSFRNTAKLLFGSNFPIQTEIRDEAFEERKIIIPFRYSVPKDEQDPDLLEKLRGEYPGIVNKAIAAYKKWIENHRRFPVVFIGEGSGEKANYAVLNQNAISGCFVHSEDENDFITSAQAYQYYMEFCQNQGITPSTQDKFSRAMTDNGFEKKKSRVSGGNVATFFGIRLNLKNRA